MSEAPKTVWVTGLALTEGVVESRAFVNVYGEAMVEHDIGGCCRFDRTEWHPTREAALTRANEMKAAKIASLKRQIERLEALVF